MKTITITDVLDGLATAVNERGEGYRYHDNLPAHAWGGCLYVVDGEPACIAAVVLSNLGAPIEALERLDKASGSIGGGWTIDADPAVETLGTYGVSFEDTESIKVLRAAQREQDLGESWGEAYAVAEDKAGLIERGVVNF